MVKPNESFCFCGPSNNQFSGLRQSKIHPPIYADDDLRLQAVSDLPTDETNPSPLKTGNCDVTKDSDGSPRLQHQKLTENSEK